MNVVTWIFAIRAPLNQKSASHHWNVCVNSAFNSIIITVLCAAIALFVASAVLLLGAEQLESVNFHLLRGKQKQSAKRGPSCAAKHLETMPANSGERPKLQKELQNFKSPETDISETCFRRLRAEMLQVLPLKA